MNYLCIDTSTNYLFLALYQDENLLNSISLNCPRNQSELLFPQLIELFKNQKITKKDLDGIVVSIGPGSYTGVRIALTMAKVIATLNPQIKLYSLNSNLLYLGNDQTGVSIIDARGNKAYIGYYNSGEFNCQMVELTEDLSNFSHYYHDANLFGYQVAPLDVIANFIDLKNQWQEVTEAKYLNPIYLK